MPIEDDDRPRKKISHDIGQDLSLLSVEELAERIALMTSEIERLQSRHDQKARLQGRCEQFFQVVRATRLSRSVQCPARAGHPRLCSCNPSEDVDGRDEPAMTHRALGQWPTWQMKAEENLSFTIN